MAAEQDGYSKGFAFVEFEEEVGASVAFIHERLFRIHLSMCRKMLRPRLVQITTNSRSAE